MIVRSWTFIDESSKKMTHMFGKVKKQPSEDIEFVLWGILTVTCEHTGILNQFLTFVSLMSKWKHEPKFQAMEGQGYKERIHFFTLLLFYFYQDWFNYIYFNYKIV